MKGDHFAVILSCKFSWECNLLVENCWFSWPKPKVLCVSENLCYNLCCKSRCILNNLNLEPHNLSVLWLKRSELCQLFDGQTFWKSIVFQDSARGCNLNLLSFPGHYWRLRVSCLLASLKSLWDMPSFWKTPISTLPHQYLTLKATALPQVAGRLALALKGSGPGSSGGSHAGSLSRIQSETWNQMFCNYFTMLT